MTKSLILTFVIAAFITLLSRLKYMIENPHEVKRYENGEIDWKHNIFINAVELIIGGVVGIGIGIVFEYYHLLDGNMLMLAVAMSGLAGGKIFEAIQHKIHKRIEHAEDEFDF